MWSFLSMVGSYENRKVNRTETELFTIDTCLITDRAWQYETAIKHKKFNNGDWIVIGSANTKEEAGALHYKMVNFYAEDSVKTITDIWSNEVFERES